uniref:Uncharacterized protein n=1 Tax=viral metagenome TaxID=1070528 RepID=A0A6C0ES99_9ZZZZ
MNNKILYKEECDEYGFFCDLEEPTEKYNKENYEFIIKISTPKKNKHNFNQRCCYHVSIGISIIVTAIIIFSIK